MYVRTYIPCAMTGYPLDMLLERICPLLGYILARPQISHFEGVPIWGPLK